MLAHGKMVCRGTAGISDLPRHFRKGAEILSILPLGYGCCCVVTLRAWLLLEGPMAPQTISYNGMPLSEIVLKFGRFVLARAVKQAGTLDGMFIGTVE